jgi:outer membrane immunogenic protein
MFRTTLAALALTAGVALSSSTALAADPYVDPAFDWSGHYFGLQAGYVWGESNHTDAGGTTTGDFDMDGFAGGLTLGWNFQSSNLVFGLESDFSLSDVDGSTNNGCGAAGCHTEIDWFSTSRGRLGFAFDNALLYATAGLATADVDASTSGLASNSDMLFGWTAGAGVEFAFNQNFSLKAEYLYMDLGKINVPTPSPVKAKVDENHIARIGLNWHF